MNTEGGGKPADVLGNPIVGMSPWIIFALLSGPGRFEIAVASALAAFLVLIVADRVIRRGGSWKLLEAAGLVFFAAMTVVGAVAGNGARRWLETYADEMSNIALALIVFGSMAARMPFTLRYAREQVDRAYWRSPDFVRANYVISGVWGLAFLVSAIAGVYGDLVLQDPGDMWTGWIIQVAAIVGAVRFTGWYSGVVRARSRGR
jgi:hypothetical protein